MFAEPAEIEEPAAMGGWDALLQEGPEENGYAAPVDKPAGDSASPCVLKAPADVARAGWQERPPADASHR